MISVRRWFPLVLITSLSLFLELAIIRWISGEVQLFSYFKNLPLLAAFLGLSIGFAQVGKGRNFRPAFAPLMGILVALTIAFSMATDQRGMIYPGNDVHIWETANWSYWISLLLFLGIILVFFLLIMFVFVVLGQATGEEMAFFPPVQAYVVNILASLLGVWIFTLVSYWRTQPVVWFGPAILNMKKGNERSLARGRKR